jgi:hypothetical protein
MQTSSVNMVLNTGMTQQFEVRLMVAVFEQPLGCGVLLKRADLRTPFRGVYQ